MNEIAPIKDAGQEVWRPAAALNLERLQGLWQLAQQIAQSSIIPETLTHEKPGLESSRFSDAKIVSNIFAVIDQADRWNISPFALLGSSAIVRGKLAFEGKVVAAVMESQFGVKLYAYYRGEPRTDDYRVYLCDEPLPEEILAALKPGYRSDRYRIIDGSVGEWKTTHNGSPWKPGTYNDMLVYRGSRQWARVYKPAAILGVLADDEVQQLALENAAQNAVPIGQRFAPETPKQGFSPDNVATALDHKPQVAEVMDSVTGEFKKVPDPVATTVSEAQPDAKAKTTSPGSEADKARASAMPTDQSAGGVGSTVTDGSRPQDSASSAQRKPADDADGGADPAPVRVSAAVFRDYHSALARVTSVESIEKNHQQFWKGKGVKLSHPEDLQLAKDINKAHVDRVSTPSLKPAAVAAEIDSWIQKVTGEVAL